MEREEIIKEFAMNLRIARAKIRMPQENLAEKAGITPEYLARIEAGKYSPSLVVIVNLAISLNIPIEELIKIPCQNL
jgi:transcriptional regulator with XRE-family HTH domain